MCTLLLCTTIDDLKDFIFDSIATSENKLISLKSIGLSRYVDLTTFAGYDELSAEKCPGLTVVSAYMYYVNNKM